jgi:Flp pilus assembly protein TadD
MTDHVGPTPLEDRLALLVRGLLERGVAAGHVRDWPVVARSFRHMLLVQPALALAWRNLGFVGRMVLDWDRARVGYGRALIVAPIAADYLHDMARLERECGHTREAGRLCRRAMLIEPGDINFYIGASAAAHDLSDLDTAWPMCLRARAIQPDSAPALSNLARVLVRRGHFGLVGRATRRLLCADPRANGGGSMLASAWTAIARTDGAIKVARRTLLMTPLDGELRGTLARAELKTGEAENAIASVRRYCLINPASAYALLTLAEASVEREDLSLCEVSSRWLRVVSSDRGSGVADSVASSGRPAVFVHIPKTAGSSVGRGTYAFTTAIGHRWIEYEPTEEDRHYGAWVAPNLLIDRAVLDRRYVFSNTRHLLPILVSFYEHCRRGFASPVMIDLCRRARTEPFADFLERIAEADTPWISRRFIFAPFFERSTGRFIIDWINRTEQVDDDLPLMCRNQRYPYRGVGRSNRKVKTSWRAYYSDDLVELAWRVWAREVALFGFTRDGGYLETAPLHRDVTGLKPRLAYDWRDDTLRLDGVVFDGRDASVVARAAGP